MLRMAQEICMSLILAITVCVSDDYKGLFLSTFKKGAASKELNSLRGICVGSDQFIVVTV